MLQEMMEKRTAEPETRLEGTSPQSPNKSITRPQGDVKKQGAFVAMFNTPLCNRVHISTKKTNAAHRN